MEGNGGGELHVQTNMENENANVLSPSSSSMIASMSDSISVAMSESQHEADMKSPRATNECALGHKDSVASSLNGLDEATAVTSTQKQSAAAKLESRSKEELIQLIRKQLGLLKETRRARDESRNEADTLRKQIADYEAKAQQKNPDSLMALELSDYKKGIESLRKKCDAADKELAEKDTLIKDLSIKMHDLTEKNAELQETVSRRTNQIAEHENKVAELNNQLLENRNEFDRQRGELESKIEGALREADEMRETIKKQRKELKSVRNEGADHKNELHQLQKANEILQKKHDDLVAEFTAYKDKAEFVLKQQRAEQQKAGDGFEVEELQRQLRQKHEQINQLSERTVGLQQEIYSSHERCRVLRAELEDARQSVGMAHKEVAEERRRVTAEYEQRVRHLAKELEDNKREIALLREQATAERQKQDDIHARVTAELNASIAELQQKLRKLEANADNPSTTTDVTMMKQRTPEREQQKRPLVTPINFNAETRFSLRDIGESSGTPATDRDEMLNSLSDLINGGGVEPPTSEVGAGFPAMGRSQSRSSMNSWTEPEDLEAQLQHTRDVLHETEQLNAKLEAQVDFLKKEIRRIQADVESAQHINKNMSYFKNIMLKFLAPEKTNDVRPQMLPVLATMLALSPDEIKSVEAALRAQQQERETLTSEWSGYFGPLSGIF